MFVRRQDFFARRHAASLEQHAHPPPKFDPARIALLERRHPNGDILGPLPVRHGQDGDIRERERKTLWSVKLVAQFEEFRRASEECSRGAAQQSPA